MKNRTRCPGLLIDMAGQNAVNLDSPYSLKYRRVKNFQPAEHKQRFVKYENCGR